MTPYIIELTAKLQGGPDNEVKSRVMFDPEDREGAVVQSESALQHMLSQLLWNFDMSKETN